MHHRHQHLSLRPLMVVLCALSACGGGAGEPGPDSGTRVVPEGELVDPLSMPYEPTLEMDAFRGAQECALCHPIHVDQWRRSSHAYAMKDPVFRALVALRQDAFDGQQDRFCLQCHTAIGTRGGDIQPGFDFEALAAVSLEGVTCEACHKVSGLERPFNSGHTLDPDGPMRGPIDDPMDNAFHASERSPLHEDPSFCGGCHDVLEVSGLNLERPYAEFLESPGPAAGTSCQGCHMPTYRGPAAVDGPERDVHEHHFVGAGVPLDPSFLTTEERRARHEQVRALLTGAATLSLSAPQAAAPGDVVNVLVSVKNNIVGHNFPTGSTFNRQVWVQLEAFDADGRTLYRTGDLDSNGDLRDYFSASDPYGDTDLISFSSRLVDNRGNPTILPWVAAEHFSSSIPPLYTRTHTLFVPTATTTRGPVSIAARVQFREYGPHLLRALGLHELIDGLETYTVDTATLSVSLSSL